MAKILDGKSIAEKILSDIKKYIKMKNLNLSLLIVLCGKNKGSLLYTNLKKRKGEKVGIKVEIKKFSEKSDESEIINVIKTSHHDGVIVQLPLPSNKNKNNILSSIPPEKDVDGLTKHSIFTPATPKGIIRLLKEYGVSVKGKNIIIINDSMIVGRPLANLMLDKGATVTICNKFTKDINIHTKKADIVVSGVGIPNFIKKDMIKESAVVIDVGISKKQGKVLGDVDFDSVNEKASFITPVPGGVGPMTIAMLLENIVNKTR
ncbi:bifunctional methylenetetrahydrofolate dehydrogenase/methenyltetrahydrofolate cyclohydrolase [Candidatus Woesearchaeota archaeon]|nr:bifunctional methylenetetrahydrofolate dehydrogenase/methenyltetrahydrofolate cyclohydrolase [Candidatus Woesearchaeota archaeon]